MGDIIKRDFNKKFMHNQELADKIFAVLDEYDGEISLAETLGVLRLIETILIKTHVELDDGRLAETTTGGGFRILITDVPVAVWSIGDGSTEDTGDSPCHDVRTVQRNCGIA